MVFWVLARFSFQGEEIGSVVPQEDLRVIFNFIFAEIFTPIRQHNDLMERTMASPVNFSLLLLAGVLLGLPWS